MSGTKVQSKLEKLSKTSNIACRSNWEQAKLSKYNQSRTWALPSEVIYTTSISMQFIFWWGRRALLSEVTMDEVATTDKRIEITVLYNIIGWVWTRVKCGHWYGEPERSSWSSLVFDNGTSVRSIWHLRIIQTIIFTLSILAHILHIKLPTNKD